MKNRLFLWITLLALLCVPSGMLAASVVQFKFMSGGADITSQLSNASVAVYQNGAVLATASWGEYYDDVSWSYKTGDGSVTLDDALVGTKLAYVSSLGHKGEFTVQAEASEIELNCSKLTVTAKDDEGNAMSDYSISLLGITGTSVGIDENGQGAAYVVPGLYTYSWHYGSGTIDLTNDNTLSLTAKVEKIEEQKTYTLRIQPRYGNFPVAVSDSYYYLYQDGAQLTYIYSRSDYTYWSTTVTAGTYEIRDKLGGTSGEVKIESDTIIYLDYHKVTFTSKCGSEANVGQVIGIGRGSDDYFSSSMSTSTDATGSAEFYLLSGTYKYSVAGSTTEFTVASEDLSFSIETVKLTFKVQCDNLNAVSFRVNGQVVAVADDGTFSYGCLPGSAVELEVMSNSYNSYYGTTKMTVTADASKTIDVKLHALQFTSNYTSANRISVRSSSTNSSFTAEWNRKYYLIEGTYAYQDPVTSAYVDLNLTEDKTIDFNFATVTVNVVDTDGKIVTDTYVRLGSGSSVQTDKSGNAVFHLVSGTYTLSWNSMVSEEITIESDMQTTLTIPAVVNFSVVNLNINDSYSRIYTLDNIYVGSIYEGVNAVRLDPAVDYCISGYHGTTKITEGCTIQLGTLSISSEGMGLAFPMEDWEAVSKFSVIVGTTARLTAIPVKDDKFTKWTINGKDYDSPVIDFKITEQTTVATAVFGGSGTNNIRAIQTSTTLSFNDSYITLPNDMEGVARIYTTDGKLVKQLGVVGSQIGIYDLPAGTYVLSMQGEDGVINASFMKK